jgi:TctA family transporter
MALFLYLGIDLGSPDTFHDTQLFDSMTYGFLAGTAITAVLCYALAYFAGWVTRVPYVYYFPFILGFIVWATVQYSHSWSDILMLVICSALGLFCKEFQFSRPALLIGFLLSDRIYSLTYQLVTLHTPAELVTRPIFVIIMLCVIMLGYWGITKRSRIDYV